MTEVRHFTIKHTNYRETKHKHMHITYANELSHDMTTISQLKPDFRIIVSNYRNNVIQPCLKSTLQHNLFQTYTKSPLLSTLEKTLTLYIRNFQFHKLKYQLTITKSPLRLQCHLTI